MDKFNRRTLTTIDEDYKDFDKLAQLIGNNIQKIFQNVSSMNTILMRLIKIKDADHVKQNLRKISNYTQQLTKDTNYNLKELYEIRHTSQTEQMKFKIHKERLAERFKSALSEFEAVQCKALEKENELMKLTKSSESAKILSQSSSSDHRDDYSTFNDNMKNKNNQTQIQIQYSVDPKVIQRHREILQIQNDVNDVHEMYKEISKFVDDQRPMVDDIERNTLESVSLIEQGRINIQEASQYQNKFRKRLCYLLVICTVIILIILYFIFK